MKKYLLGGSPIAFAAADFGSGVMETKEDAVAPKAKTPNDDTKAGVKELMVAFGEHKEANDARLKNLETADPLLDEKLTRIGKTLDEYEKYSKDLGLIKAQSESLVELQKSFDEMQTALKRKGAGPEETTARAETWCRGVVDAVSKGELNLGEEQRKVLQDVAAEYKALSVSTDTAGGYLAPMEYVLEIIKSVTEISPVRSLARVRQTSQKAIQIPKRTGTFSASWVAEQGTKSESTGLAYGLNEIPTHEFYALIDISNQMFEDSAFNINAEISFESAEQFALAEGTAFVNGTGVGQPEGFMINGDVGTTLSGATATILADGLISLKHALKTAYTKNAHFLLNRTSLGAIRKLKTTDLQYLWAPGLASGTPNSIDGDPYLEVTDMADEGAGLKPVAYGDFKRAYTWVDRIQMEMLRDPYTQATSGNVRFIMRKRVGGQVVLAEAIRTLTCATS